MLKTKLKSINSARRTAHCTLFDLPVLYVADWNRRSEFDLSLSEKDPDALELQPRSFKKLFVLTNNPFTATPPLKYIQTDRDALNRSAVPARQPCCLSIPPRTKASGFASHPFRWFAFSSFADCSWADFLTVLYRAKQMPILIVKVEMSFINSKVI
jgi:hypothetical protein